MNIKQLAELVARSQQDTKSLEMTRYLIIKQTQINITQTEAYIDGIVDFCHPEIYDECERTHLVNGVEVPAPMIRSPDINRKAWFIDPCEETGVDYYPWRDTDTTCKLLFKRGEIFKTEGDALLNAKARWQGLK